MAEETMPISFATARSDSPAAPSVASCRRAISVISLISSARTLSRAVRLAFTETQYQSTALKSRAPLAELRVAYLDGSHHHDHDSEQAACGLRRRTSRPWGRRRADPAPPPRSPQ